MYDEQQSGEPSGIQLMRLMDAQLFDILRREHSNQKSIHLYGTGEYWSAFEASAYLLCQLFPKNEVTILTHAAYPFPIVMASITARQLKAYSRSHIFKHDETDYKELVAAEISADLYHTWHRREVLRFR